MTGRSEGGLAVEATAAHEGRWLREREARFRALALALEPVIWTTDAEGRVVEDSPTWRAFTGQTREQWFGWGWLDAVHPADRDRVRRTWANAVTNRSLYEVEYRLRTASGEYRWTVARAAPVLDEDGTVREWVGANIDVTDRKRVEMALREGEERYRAIVEGQAEMVCRFRRDGTILFANGAYARSRGTTPEALVGVNFWDFIEEADRPAVRALLEGLTVDAPDVRIENRFETSQGVRWTLWTNRGLAFGPDGRATELQSSGIDITDRREAEAALQRSELEFRTLFELSAVGAAQAELPSGRFLRVNRRFCEITGYTEAELQQLTFSELTHPDDRERNLAVVGPVLRGEAGRWEIEKRYVRPDGSTVWVHVVGRTVDSVDGRPRTSVANIVDISERKRAEVALQESEATLAAIVERLPVGVAVLDGRGRLRSINSAGLALHGVSSVEAMPPDFRRYRRRYRLLRSDGTPLEGREWPLARALRGAPVHDEEIRLHRQGDGEERVVAFSALRLPEGRDDLSRLLCVMHDVTDRKRHEEHLRTVMAELNHRVKNLLAVIQSVAQQTARHAPDPESFQASLQERLRSMASAHSLLTQSNWEGARLEDILRGELESRVGSVRQFIAQGPTVMLRPKAALALNMAVHELATNACKYGALATGEGRVEVRWEIRCDRGDRRVRLRWSEHCGRPVEASSRVGFGTTLVEQVLGYELDGEVRREFAPDGLRCTIEFPLASTLRSRT